MTTRTYKQIQDQIAALQAEAEQLRQRELSDARTKVMAIMQEYGIKADELTANSGRGKGARGAKGLKLQAENQGQKKATRTRGPSTPKYKNPETGATWTGMGRMPNWAKGKDLEQMRIGQ